MALGARVLGFLDPAPAGGATVALGLPCLGDEDRLAEDPALAPAAVHLANGLGSLPGRPSPRRAAFQRLEQAGYRFPPLCHPGAHLAAEVILEEGAQVMAGVIVQTGSRIGRGSILNTGARVDHDCRLGPHVHVAPGAVLSGGVVVGEGAHLGTGCAVIQNIAIGAGAVVAAGAAVRRDLAPGATLHPAKGTLKP